MDAWETLLDTSTLIPPGFDAWEHLNAQGGGTGYVLIDTVEVEVMSCYTDVEIENLDIDVEIEPDIGVEIDSQEIEVEIECNE